MDEGKKQKIPEEDTSETVSPEEVSRCICYMATAK
jgi:hypothetical protein